ncbi:MAG: hypothetical protein ABIW76_11725, partial [Fibrobacteria bacterium]
MPVLPPSARIPCRVPARRERACRGELILGLSGLALLLGACSSTRKAPAQSAETRQQEIKNDQRAFIAHEFFLRARQQEMDGNDAMALS